MRLLILCLAFLAAGCAAAPAPAPVEPVAYAGPLRSLTAAEQRAIADAVKHELKDPDSAQFRWPKIADAPTTKYCGSVNARNSYGGYTGFKAFAVEVTRGAGRVTYIGMDGDTSHGLIGISQGVCRGLALE